MKAMIIEDGRLEIVNGSRTVATTDGTLICLLPTLRSFSTSVSFPHPVGNDHCYAWSATQTYAFDPSSAPDHYLQQQTAQVFFTSLAEEVETATTLMAAPDGADVFFGMVKLNRTVDPTHAWNGQTLTPLQKEDEWVPWNGSGQIEAALGISRLLHLVIEGGSLKLIAQQSVGPATGGQDHEFGDYPNIFPAGASRSGGNFQSLTTPGLIRWQSSSSPYRKTASRTVDTDLLPGSYTTLQRGQSGECDTTDPTNYLSTYAVDVRGYFGRRS